MTFLGIARRCRGVSLGGRFIAALRRPVGAENNHTAVDWELANSQKFKRNLQSSSHIWAKSDGAFRSGIGVAVSTPDHSEDFQRHADLYLGGLWNKVERGLRQMEGEEFEFEVEMKSGELSVKLPDKAEIRIKKNTDDSTLVVHSNMNDYYGSHDPDQEVSFKLCNGCFEADGESLHTYIEDGLAKHLKIQINLDPEVDTISEEQRR